jgi:predicted nucleic acid-binding protein
MIFVDANIFVHASVVVRGELPESVRLLKEQARRVAARISGGEPVATSVVHLSEVANVLRAKMPLQESIQYVIDIIRKVNVTVLPVSRSHYWAACSLAQEKNVGVNDALAVVLMREARITEIYTTDTKHFRLFSDITVRIA